MKDNPFCYPIKGLGRPQILLIGNGLEYESHQKSWEELLGQLAQPGAVAPTNAICKDIPFPLLYQLITTPLPANAHLSAADLKNQNQHLACVMRTLKHSTNRYLDMLPELGADHIMSTNYSYCMEAAFFPGEDFTKSERRSKRRCYLAKKSNGKPVLNTDLWTRFLKLSETHKITTLWIKGHAGHPENERCDKMAVGESKKFQ